MATDRLSDYKLGTGDELKRIGTARRLAASSCNAFAIATFSSLLRISSSELLIKTLGATILSFVIVRKLFYMSQMVFLMLRISIGQMLSSLSVHKRTVKLVDLSKF